MYIARVIISACYVAVNRFTSYYIIEILCVYGKTRNILRSPRKC